MFESYVFHHSGVHPYRVVVREEFHTEFAARLFGWLETVARGEYHHWNFKHIAAPEDGGWLP